MKITDKPESSEITLNQGPFSYRLKVTSHGTSMRFRRIMLIAALRKLQELFREPGYAWIHHEDGHMLNVWYEETRELSFQSIQGLESPEGQLGLALKRERDRAGLTLRELAQLTGLSVTHLCRIERGKVLAKRETVRRIEKAIQSTNALGHEESLIQTRRQRGES